jgi:UDP-N-acetylglucosamine:LPS N-acetylglucosamine transferase
VTQNARVKGLTQPVAQDAQLAGASLADAPAMRRARAAPRVLLLTSGLGCGHVRAAQAVADALRRREPRAKIRTLDFWSLMNPGVAATIQRKYLELVTGHPELYARLHSLDERTWRRVLENQIAPPDEVLELIALVNNDDSGTRSVSSLFEWALGPYPSDLLLYPTACAAMPTTPGTRASTNVALLRLALFRWAFLRLQGRMEQRLLDFAPDVVVATQMVPAALVAGLKQATRRWHDLPLTGVLTDFGAHDYWIQPGVDLYCVPHDSLAAGVLAPAAGRSRVRVRATGVPLMPSFEELPSQQAARRWAGLDPGDTRPVVLVLGGGLGLGVDGLVIPLLERLPDARIVVMAGHNDHVLEQMRALGVAAQGRLAVRGWTEHMENFVVASDLVIGKPGGLTVAEVLACGRPLLVTKSLQGQESFNVRFLERHQVGRLVSLAELPDEAAAWLANPAELQRVQQRSAALGRRDGAAQVAALVLEQAAASRRLEQAAAWKGSA